MLKCVLMLAGGIALEGCEILPHPGDTQGVQEAGEWDQRGRIVVRTDPRYTAVYLRVDTTNVAERHDALLARFDFNPSDADGDEYALTIALDLGDARRLSADHRYSLGDSIPAWGTVTCLCRPLRPDSVRGTYAMQTRGSRQIAGRIEATLYFTAWDDPRTHATYRLQQRIHGVRP
ncbi:MAG: hypothetical protein ABR537_07670 [Gemmatimonadales bacterium]